MSVLRAVRCLVFFLLVSFSSTWIWILPPQARCQLHKGLWSLEFLGPLQEKAMAPYSSPLAWKIPWMEEPGRLQSMGSRRVGHDWATSLSLFTFMHWRRKWPPTPVFLPGESQGWGCIESDTTEVTLQNQLLHTESSQNTALGWLLSFFSSSFHYFFF